MDIDDMVDMMSKMKRTDFLLLHMPSKSSKILSCLNEMRYSSECIDLVVRIDTSHIPCHRAILAASSHYFKSMFTHNLMESVQTTVTLMGLSAESVEAIIDYSYTSKIYIHKETVEELFETASFLQYETISKACSEFMITRLEASNCIHYYTFAEHYNCTELLQSAKSFMLDNFLVVSTTLDFLGLSSDELMDLISNDNLKVENEAHIVDAILRWVQFDESRKYHVTQLLKKVRLALLDDSYLSMLEERNDLSLSCLIDEAVCCKTLIHKGYRVMGRQTAPRFQDRQKDILIIIGGHRNELDCGYTYSESVMYNETDNGTLGNWKSLTSLPNHKKRKYSVTARDWSIVVTGGYDADMDQSIADTWQFNFLTNEWHKLADMKMARHSHGSATLNGDIYVVGGKSSIVQTRLSSVEVYKSFHTEWQECKNLPTGVSVAAVVGCQEKLYVIGGANDAEDPASLIQCFDPTTHSWTMVTDVQVCRKIPQALAFKNGIVIIGARKQREVISYNPETRECKKLAACNQQRAFSAAVASKGKIWLLGGKLYGEANDSIDCYDENTNDWVDTGEHLPNALYMLGAVLLPAASR